MGPMDLGIKAPAASRLKRDIRGGGGMGMLGGMPKPGGLDIQQPKMGGTAPNLRPAEDPAMSCANCAHFDGRGACQKFGNECMPTETCDAFEGAGQEDMGEAPAGPPMMG
jgi:hypothetical protein